MQAYQIPPAASAGWCRLVAMCIGLLPDRSGSKRHAGPGSPGRARHSYPYPHSRRRRRQ